MPYKGPALPSPAPSWHGLARERAAIGRVAAMASASPPSGKAAPLPEVQQEEEEEATRRQIEHWRSELSNLGAERSRLQRWRASQVRTAAASTLL